MIVPQNQGTILPVGQDFEALDPYSADEPIILQRSLFDKRPNVLFFPYPP